MTTQERIKLSSPADVAATIPAVLGFHPAESLVVMCLSGGDAEPRTVSLTLRYDLPGPDSLDDSDDRGVANDVVGRVARYGSAVILTCFTDAQDGDELAHRRLIDHIMTELGRAGIGYTYLLLVRNGRVWSYDNASPPGELIGDNPAGNATAASIAYHNGRVIRSSRNALTASIAGPEPDDDTRRTTETIDHMVASYSERLRDNALGMFRRYLDAVDYLDAATARCMIAAVSTDKEIRDAVISWGTDHDTRPALLDLLIRLARITPDESLGAAPVCTMVAAVAYLDGDGAFANIAIDRALANDTDYSLARLLLIAMDNSIPPEHLGALLMMSQGLSH